jgi:hypothetical protein
MGMLNKILTLIVLTLLFGTTLKGAEIRFTATEYAGSSFTFYTVPNFLTDKQEIIAEGVVDEKGNSRPKLKWKAPFLYTANLAFIKVGLLPIQMFRMN